LILFSLPVALSLADTCRMPLASMSKVTSICGMPRGEGGMSVRLNWPRLLLPSAISRSPCSTWMVTAVLVVVGGREHLRGLGRDRGVLLDQLGHHAAQRLDAQRQRGHVEQQHVLDVAFQHAALDRAPTATASSGLTSLRGSLPKNSFTLSCTFGMRVWPPTRITSSMSESLTPASLIAMRQGSMVRSIRSSTRLRTWRG
jgi:hypothetical protein